MRFGSGGFSTLKISPLYLCRNAYIMLACQDLHVAWREFDMDVYSKDPTKRPPVRESLLARMHTDTCLASLCI